VYKFNLARHCTDNIYTRHGLPSCQGLRYGDTICCYRGVIEGLICCYLSYLLLSPELSDIPNYLILPSYLILPNYLIIDELSDHSPELSDCVDPIWIRISICYTKWNGSRVAREYCQFINKWYVLNGLGTKHRRGSIRKGSVSQVQFYWCTIQTSWEFTICSAVVFRRLCWT